jgi:hypothetical protein
MGELVSFEQVARYRQMAGQRCDETPEQFAFRVKRPQTFSYTLKERAPHERPIPEMPEILQPDVIDMLQRLQHDWIADKAVGW